MRSTIRNRLTYAFVGLSVIPLLLVGIGVVWQIVSVQQTQALLSEEQVARQVARELEEFILSLEADLQSLIQVNSLLNLTPAEQKITFTELMAFQDAFEELVLLDRRGDEKIRLSRLNIVTDKDLSNRSSANEFVQPTQTLETYYSAVWFDNISGEPLMTIAIPLVNLRTAEVEGVLVANIRLKKIWDLIAAMPTSTGESVYIINDQGRLIAHRNPSFVLRNTPFVVPAENGVYQGLEGKSVFLAKEELGFGDQLFYVVAEKEVVEALSLAVNTTIFSLAMVVIVYLIASVFGVVLVRQIVQPVQALADTANQIKDGDLSVRVAVPKRDDEVRKLAETFNVMATQLQDSMTGLEEHIQKLQETEKALTAYAVELERSNRELQSFAYIASHDLQEPLRKIQTFSDRMHHIYADTLDQRGVDYLVRMQSAGERMQVLIQDLLTFSRVTTNSQQFVDVDLNQVVGGVLEDLEITIEETQAEIVIGNLPTIEADSLQMRQLFQNLIGNALKFHKQNVRPVIMIASEQIVPQLRNENVNWKITITDNGIGFNEKYLDRIFTLFQRLHDRQSYSGTGVGLAICRKIVELHHGQITAQSKLDEGTTFLIHLPEKQKSGKSAHGK